MNKLIAVLIVSLSSSIVNAENICTDYVKIERLSPRSDGWVHVIAEGVNNMDLSGCGNNSVGGMLLNYSDTSGTVDGKKMLYNTLLSAFVAGARMKLCSKGCDSVHSTYSRLDYINDIRM